MSNPNATLGSREVADKPVVDESGANSQSIYSSPNENGDSKVENIIQLIEECCSEIFLDQFAEPFAFIKESGKVVSINSSDFEDFILFKYFNKNRVIVNKENLKNAIRIIRAKTAIKNEAKKMFVRTALFGNDLLYDLGGNRAVTINQNGWSITTNPPGIFKKFKSQMSQVDPARGGNLDDFISILNLSGEDDKILLKVYLVSSFIYGYPHPILIIFGQHGAAKTTLCRFLKSLLDPSSIGTLSPITNIKEFIQAISHHWAAFFDNFSTLKTELSDALCRVCTGDGFSKRRLYTDDDDMVYSFRHVVGLNGINNVASKSDLLDRSLLIELARIPEESRKTEQEIEKRFEAIKPGIIGACFDAIVKALSIYPTVKIAKTPRMSDFAIWGSAIAEALGIGGDRFIEAYKRNILKQNMEAIEASPVAYAIKTLIEREPTGVIEASPMYIYNRLKNEAHQAEFDYTTDDSWPRNVRWFSRKLTEVIPNLKKIGINIEKGKGVERWIKIETTDQVRFDSSVQEQNDAIDRAKKFERGEIGLDELDVNQIPF